MADINSNININVNGNAEDSLNNISNKLNGLQTNQTKITQSTSAFTKETNKLNDGLIKNGGAMGLLSAATGGLAMDFKDGIEAVEGLGISMKGLRGAIISTGIGALAILVLELVTNWDKWIGVIDGSTAAMDRLNLEIDSNNKKREESNRISQLTTSGLEEELRLMIAQGVEQDKIIAQQNTISAAKKEQAQADKLSFEDDLRNIQQLIDSNGELLELNRELKQLEEGKIRLQNAGSDFSVTQQAIIDKKSEISELEKELGLNEKRKVALDGIADAQLIINTTTMDPKVRAAELASAATADRKAEIQRQLNIQLQKEKQLRSDIAKLLSNVSSDVKSLGNINDLLRNISSVDLGSTYAKWKQLTDAFNNTRDITKSLADNMERLNKLNRQMTKDEKKQLDNSKQLFEYYKSNVKIINELIDTNNALNSVKDTFDKATQEEIENIRELSHNYDILANSIREYEKMDFNPFGNIDTTEDIFLSFEKIDKQLDLISAKALNQESLLLYDKALLDGNIASLQKRNKEILDEEKDIIDKVEELRSQNLFDFENNQLNLTDVQLLKIRELYDNINKLDDIQNQSRAKTDEINNIKNVTRFEKEKLLIDASIEMERYALEEKLSMQQDYATKVQTLQQNIYDFVSVLQNEAIVEDKNVRNILLVAQKGAEIAQVVMNTVKENASLKQKVGEYTKNAILYKGLAVSSAAINPVAAASYAGSAAAYTAGAAASGAQIPINWGIAAGSIASIAATTLTSWNKSSGGAGGSAGGSGGGGSAAQFNIVGSSGENQLAATIAAQQNMPLRAYVVGSDVSTQMALDRNIVRNSTFL